MLRPFKILSEEKLFEIPGRFTFIESELETPEGKMARWNIISCKELAVVLALTSENEVYLKREWRLNRKDFVWEVASGWVDVQNPTESDIQDAAQRELQEEIGMRAGTLTKLMSF